MAVGWGKYQHEGNKAIVDRSSIVRARLWEFPMGQVDGVEEELTPAEVRGIHLYSLYESVHSGAGAWWGLSNIGGRGGSCLLETNTLQKSLEKSGRSLKNSLVFHETTSIWTFSTKSMLSSWSQPREKHKHTGQIRPLSPVFWILFSLFPTLGKLGRMGKR